MSDYQLSLAIGKEGQNARLAARLTGWRIDIKSETQLAEEESGYAGEEWAEGEWIQNEAGEMVWQPAEGGDGGVGRPSGPQGAEGADGPGAELAAEDVAEAEVEAVEDAGGRRGGRRRCGGRRRPGPPGARRRRPRVSAAGEAPA